MLGGGADRRPSQHPRARGSYAARRRRDRWRKHLARPASRPAASRRPAWYKDAIIYQLHVKAFFDSNGDGMGDFAGLTAEARLHRRPGRDRDLAAALLSRRPLRDDGYDIADYYGVHPDYGTLRDFRAFVREAHRRGLRVITELVVNHTSDQHPWFVESRASRGQPEARLVRLERRPTSATPTRGSSSPTPRRRNWAWDHGRAAVLLAPLLQPPARPQLRQPARCCGRCCRSMRFWLDLGVDGLRLDAMPYLFEREGTNCENLPETHAFLKRLRAAMDAQLPRPHAAGRGQPVAARTCARTSATATNATWRSTSRSCRASAWRCGGRIAIRSSRSWRRRPAIPRRLPVGDLPAQPRRADARDGDRRRARLHVPRVRHRPRGRGSTSASGAGWRRWSRTAGAGSSSSTAC